MDPTQFLDPFSTVDSHPRIKSLPLLNSHRCCAHPRSSSYALDTELDIKHIPKIIALTLKMEAKNKNVEAELKHLGLVRVAAIQVLLTVSSFYEYAKNNSGPLKSTVGTVEGAVGTVLGPVYDKFKGVPDSFLIFFDNKVDEAAETFDKHAPSLAKQVVSQSSVLINKVTEKAQSFVKEARTGGSKAAFKYAAMEYKGFLVTSSVKAWTKLNQYRPINKVAHKALPVAANLSSKYNDLVKEMTKKGYPVVGYLPLVPVEEIVQAYKKEDAVQQTDANKSSSDSDTD